MIRIAEDSVQQRPRVIVVEDDPSVRRSVQLLLQGRGFDVRAYGAIEPLLVDDSLDGAACLVADFQLADSDGVDLLRTLRQRGWHGPAILVTAYPTQKLRRLAADVGFAEFLEKPLADHVLVQAVTRLVGREQSSPR